jgi:site-specific DNA-methyltransferase (adenine-specific)
VKPLTLMRYLIRLVTPPGGIVLEPFAGSGTTLAAATLEGMNSIGIELTDDYLPIIEARINWARRQHTNTSDNQPNLFDDINNGHPS